MAKRILEGLLFISFVSVLVLSHIQAVSPQAECIYRSGSCISVGCGGSCTLLGPGECGCVK